MTLEYATLSWPGAIAYKEFQYTQTTGTSPDKASLKLVPQAASVASIGTMSITYDGDNLTLPNCLVDKGNIQYTPEGWVSSLVLLDRRWIWAKAAHMSVHWNDRDANGTIAQASRRSLSQMMAQILEWIGESYYDVSWVATEIYPEVNETSIHPLDLLNQLMDEYGYDITLGFGTDWVRIVKKNVGAFLPAGGVRMASTSWDPPTPPAYIRTMFGPSKLQARMKLVAIGLDTDGRWREIDDLSYKPSNGWRKVAPGGFGEVGDQHGAAAYQLARDTVYRFYRINRFADGTLNVPINAGAIGSITQVLPLTPGLYPSTTFDGNSARPKEILYGEVAKATYLPSPAGVGNTDKGDRIDVDFKVNHTQGIVEFPPGNHMYKVDGGDILPAELWLECVMQVRNNSDWQYAVYYKDVLLNQFGIGFHTVSFPEISFQSKITYNNEHVITGSVDTSSSLDAIASTTAAIHSTTYTSESGQSAWYNSPQLTMRVDGAINQVTHVISDTNGHYTVASRHMSHDVYVKDASDKRAADLERFSRQSNRRFKLAQLRRERGSA